MKQIFKKFMSVMLALTILIATFIVTNFNVNAADIVINSCEIADISSNNWVFNNVGVTDWNIQNTTDYKEGTSSIKLTSNNDANPAFLRRKATAPLAINLGTTVLSKSIQFWLKVDDVSNIRDMVTEFGTGQIEPFYDDNVYKWGISYFDNSGFLQSNQWVFVTLPISSAVKTGIPDNTSLNVFGFLIYPKTGTTITYSIDDIKIVETPINAVTTGIIDSFDGFDTTKWAMNGNPTTTVDTTDKIEGTGALKLGYGGVGTFVLQSNTTTYDFGTIASKQVEMWFYVSDKAKIDSLTFELSSSGKCDVDEYQWNILSASITNGWNKVEFKFADAGKAGTPNSTAINWVRAYYTTTAAVTIGFDNIKVSTVTAPTIPKVTTGIIDSFDNFDITKWAGNGSPTTTIDTTDKKQGTGALKLGYGGVGTFVLQSNTITYDFGTVANKQVEMWFYVNDKTKINLLTFELSSSGENDVDEYQWSISSANLTNGWNKVEFKFADAVKAGTPDSTAINWVRAFYTATAAVITGFDDIKVSTVTVPTIPTVPKDMIETFDSFDTTKWTASGIFNPTIDKADKKEGTGALKLSYTAPGTVVIQTKSKTINFSSFNKKGVEFWFYMNDKTKINMLTFELSSSGKNDVDEYQWTVPSASMVNGWNKITLAFDRATKTGNPNYAAINWVRAFYTLSGATVIGFDGLRATEVAAEIIPYVDPNTILDCNAIYSDKFAVATKKPSDVLSTNAKEGKYSYMLYSPNTKADNITFIATTPKTFSKKIIKESMKQIELWVYVSDAAKLSASQLELTSSGKSDTNEANFDLKALLKTGWNQLKLSISSAGKIGNPNFLALNYFRIYFVGSGNGGALTVLVDDVKISDIPLPPPGLISNCEAADTGMFTFMTSEPQNMLSLDAKEGTHSFRLVSDNLTDGAIALLMFKPDTFSKNIGTIDGKSVGLYIFISDISKLSGYAVELGSAGKADQDEWQWNIAASLKNGWNKVTLQFKDAVVTGNPDPKALNAFRLYAIGNGSGRFETNVDAIMINGLNPATNEHSLNGFNFVLLFLSLTVIILTLKSKKKKGSIQL